MALYFPGQREVSSAFTETEGQEIETLLHFFVTQGWLRLKPEDGDPLDVLFNKPVRRWTIGWDLKGHNLYLVSRETVARSNRPHWTLYINGECHYRCVDEPNHPFSGYFRTLLEGPTLPFIEAPQLLNRLVAYTTPREQRELGAWALAQTMLAFPELWPALRNSFFKLLEKDLGQDKWPVLDVLKIHRVDQKTVLLQMVQPLMEQGLLQVRSEKHRLYRALNQLQVDYQVLHSQISGMMQVEYDRAYQDLLRLMQSGTWWGRLAQTVSV